MANRLEPAFFTSDGIDIAYYRSAAAEPRSGIPVLLTHGFASNSHVNWVDTGWVRTLNEAGHDIIAFDHRGHGASGKPHDPDVYGSPIFARDAVALLDQLGVAAANVLGFSMGARVTAFMCIEHGERLNRAVMAGLGANMIKGLGGSDVIRDALLADDRASVTDPTARTFRAFAEATGSDLRALAACIGSSRVRVTTEALATITVPVLVAVGTRDSVGGPAQPLADAIPGAQAFNIVDRDHMKSVGDASHKRAVVEFFSQD